MSDIPTNTNVKRPTKWDEFGIDASIAFDDPMTFANNVRNKASELRQDLGSTSSLQNLEAKYKKAALSNKDAEAKATEIFDNIYNLLSEQDADVLVHLLPRLAELSEFCDHAVRGEAMRSGMNNQFSKKRTHAMYIKIRKMYEAYCMAMSAHVNEKFPMIPAVSGNYNDNSRGMAEHVFEVDGEIIVSYYHAARLCEFEAKFYMDVVTKFTGVSEINGHKVRMLEL